MRPIIELLQDWKTAALNNADFIKAYADRLKMTSLGCSLSPEQLEYLGVRTTPEQTVQFITNDLGIREVRLGLRWNRINKTPDKVDLGYYNPYIDACLKNKMRVCLNVGPIKTLRYPEDHVPNYLLQTLIKQKKLPESGERIMLDCSLTQASLDYLFKLLEQIKRLYGNHSEQLMFQPENEAFTGYGSHRWIMDTAYMQETIQRIHSFFPHNQLVINSPGVPQPASGSQSSMEQVNDFLINAVKNIPSLNGQLWAGIDYYYNTPNGQRIFTGPGRLDMNAVLKIERGQDIFTRERRRLQMAGINTEITEMQAEPWLNEEEKETASMPGNSARGFRFAILRCLDVIDPQVITPLRIWGIEHLLKKVTGNVLSSDHKQIINLCATINSPTFNLTGQICFSLLEKLSRLSVNRRLLTAGFSALWDRLLY